MGQYSTVGGELAAGKRQIAEIKSDLSENYGKIDEQYREQLIKVKVC
jgi:hypothetical protein